MQTLSDQEKKVLKIIKESEQQLMPEEITEEINKKYGQVWPVQVTLTFMARLEKLGYTDTNKQWRTGREKNKKDAEEGKEPEKTTVYYVTDEVQQSQYINMFKEEGQDALILKHNIDSAFISHVEQKKETVKFMRIDADINESVKADGEENLEEQTKELGEIFKKALGKENLIMASLFL